MTVTRERPDTRGAGAKVSQGGEDRQHRTAAGRPCPPDCATACRWPAEIELDERWPASTQLAWTLVGLAGDPLPPERWSAVTAAVERVAGPLAVAEGLEAAARQPAMAPAHTPAQGRLSDGWPRPEGRWWTEDDRQRAAALAPQYRRKVAQGVAA